MTNHRQPLPPFVPLWHATGSFEANRASQTAPQSMSEIRTAFRSSRSSTGKSGRCSGVPEVHPGNPDDVLACEKFVRPNRCMRLPAGGVGEEVAGERSVAVAREYGYADSSVVRYVVKQVENGGIQMRNFERRTSPTSRRFQDSVLLKNPHEQKEPEYFRFKMPAVERSRSG